MNRPTPEEGEALDTTQEVELLTFDPAAEPCARYPGGWVLAGRMPLADALRVVIDEWEGERQQLALIHLLGGLELDLPDMRELARRVGGVSSMGPV